jgi:hypothetical protein
VLQSNPASFSLEEKFSENSLPMQGLTKIENLHFAIKYLLKKELFVPIIRTHAEAS